MNWLDEGALYSSIGLFLREDLGRGDITTQTVLMRNAHARGRFIAGEKMVVAGLEAAEEVFVTLDPQQQIEAFIADSEEVEAGRSLPRGLPTCLAGRTSGIEPFTAPFRAWRQKTQEFDARGRRHPGEGADTRKTTPGLRMLEKYARCCWVEA
jgi:nicotinate-nucleotide pyrophosphorylase (carboxylating)